MNKNDWTADDIATSEEKYAQEARDRWGHTDAFKESTAKVDGFSAEDLKGIEAAQQDLFAEFARFVGTDPRDRRVQELVAEWKNHITANFYECTDEILRGLGLMYVADTRFTENIDCFGIGTAKLMSDAIEYYCLPKA